MKELRGLIFPGVVSVLGIVVLIAAFQTEQNTMVILGVLALILAGAIGVVMSIVSIGKPIRLGISAVLILLSAGLAYADYISIQGPLAFQKEKDRRYKHVIQRLKDIRTVQLAYKRKYQKYTGDLDSLENFIKMDSLEVIRAIGERPDTMTNEEALLAGIISRDTVLVPVIDSLFKPSEEGRIHAFNLDSLRFVPFTEGAEFELDAGFVERSSVKVPVFVARDSKPFDTNDPLQVGSMNDPKTNGNWE